MDFRRIIEIDSFWDRQSCDLTISKAEAKGFDHATVSTELGEKFALQARNNRRVVSEDPALANHIWSDLKGHVPNELGRSIACGLNEVIRYYKYETARNFSVTAIKALSEMSLKPVTSRY